MLIAGIILMIKNPVLLQNGSMQKKEEEQKRVILLGGLMFISGFVVADWIIAINGLFYPNGW